ncbi:MAG: Dyp-type peroxidase [Actinomycetota bacterium]|nr:Dyp-type peroxidase [Actinomycetota bacterium]
MTRPPVDLRRVQAWVMPGLHSAYQELRFYNLESVEDPRSLLRSLPVTSSRDAPKQVLHTALAISFRLCVRLGLDESIAFADRAFRVGMPPRAGKLHDPPASQWFVGGPKQPIDAFVTFATETSPDDVAERAKAFDAQVANAGGSVLALSAARLDDAHREHFGFPDGISQPAWAGVDEAGVALTPGTTPDATFDPVGQPLIEPGEFVFGTTGQPQTGSKPAVASAGAGPGARTADWSSMTVVRILQQDVARFRTFCDETAAAHGVDPRWLAAQIVGRWRSGAPVERYPDSDPGDSHATNDFDYHDDTAGEHTSNGAHIRKVNPRHSIEDDLVPRRRILRRGVPYGSVLPPGTADDGERRGLVFVNHQTDIAEHFEFVFHDWARSATAPTANSGRDLLIGPDPDRQLAVTHADKGTFVVTASDPFVTCQGGAYLWTPPVGDDGAPIL